MEDYGRYQWNENGLQPQNNNNHKKKNNMKKFAKKVGAIALSAVLFGGIAGGVFTGITYAAGVPLKAQQEEAEPAAAKAENKTTTLQTTSASAGSTVKSQTLDVSDIAEAVIRQLWL